jgi:hypothetical protein
MKREEEKGTLNSRPRRAPWTAPTLHQRISPHTCTLALTPSVVADAGHPTPGPRRFWSVISAAVMRACASAVPFPSGNTTRTLFIAAPASTFCTSACTLRQRERRREGEGGARRCRRRGRAGTCTAR